MGLATAWVYGPLGLVCLLIGVYHLGLLLSGRAPIGPASAHAVMGIGMAAMFVPAADPLPRPLWIGAFLVVFAWFGSATIRAGSLGGEAGRHTVGAAAMLFMLFVHGPGTVDPSGVDPEHAHHGFGAGGGPSLLVTAMALVLVAWFLADAVRHLTRPSAAQPPTGPGPTAATLVGSPPAMTLRRAVVPHLAMNAAMAFMLLGMA